MRALFSLLTFILTSLFFIGSFIYIVMRLFSQINFGPDTRAWKSTLEALRNRLKKMNTGALVPWDKEMPAILSLNQTAIKKPGFFSPSYAGIFMTIYQEPALAYAGIRNGNTGVLVMQTSDREFIFRQKGKETEIWINSQPFGIFVDGALIAAGRNGKMIGRLENDQSHSQFPVLLGDKTAAAVANPTLSIGSTPNPRAMTLLRDLSKDEENALLSMALLQMVQR